MLPSGLMQLYREETAEWNAKEFKDERLNMIIWTPKQNIYVLAVTIYVT